MRRKLMISLFDVSGIACEPWQRANCDTLQIDMQHPPGLDVLWSKSGTSFAWKYGGDIYDFFEVWEQLPHKKEDVVFVAAFPPCTDLTAAGARWWKKKAEADPLFQEKALAMVVFCRLIADHFGCPYFIENPQGRISSLWRKPDHKFEPWMFTRFSPEDNYNKRTHLWTGNGFRMPEPFQDMTLGDPEERVLSKWSGIDRKNQRSKTPRGFAEAIFWANAGETIC